ncbi:putative C6 transcription factor [Aspergillus mulundensis]|uniref:Putative Zn(II)2Cys6 transcription factor n=1 Tax=Aspergillus mulundensis TaxID=1810919 RepID=A0A3D8SV53_9EURO|nr:putative Zn(II)2Cys6 transcription factor [Aspergillus mulundensis]RDW90149.1 putative Zn(II)2Cys6 transcription factor [Aspergillus mulundensis]
MSPPPSRKNGGSHPSAPKQIRFVSTDGQPQTKRRRVNAACLTCRKRKTRCSGEKPVCRTCIDYNHQCLGYDGPSHVRAQSDTASHSSAAPSITNSVEPTASRGPSKTNNRSLEPARQNKASIGDGTFGETSKVLEPFKTDGHCPPEGSFLRPTKESGTKEIEQQAAGESPESNRTTTSSSGRTHVPYFRYFGPTAIVPGFKQMVVQVRGSRKSNASLSSDSISPLRSPKLLDSGVLHLNAIVDNTDSRDANTIPFYDREDALPVGNLVTHLCELFFVHLGCSFPFLRRDRFLGDLKDKKIDTMLVDSVCALAARFSPHPLLSPPQAPPIDASEPQPIMQKSNRGQPFANRAMNALVDSLAFPTLSVVQACLLLAYEEFGSNHDSGLWMYLGISIRMAQDLGMQKLQGLDYSYGRTGVTPSAVMTGQASKLREDEYDVPHGSSGSIKGSQEVEDRRAWERERVDTFWSIFFLDRVISSGTGRPVTLRDEDIELRFPLQSGSQLSNGWPSPFPPLIRIIHLYGRVTDLINGMQDANHVTPDTLKRLSGMESDLTGIYQRLSPRLHFNAANFQAYVKAKEGTNFILLHFWFHTVIVLLHQPTLLNSFGGTMQHLYPNSRELSMSSAKTIADILSFSELVDGKSFIGNPFTSQPMYIAACAFLMESAYYSSPSSRSVSPSHQALLANQTSGFFMDSSSSSDRKPATKHSLLASAAKENYQRCYKALKSLENYWEGTKYILTVLDQKAKGIVDPLLYTEEEMEGTAETPSTGSNWRQSIGATNPIERPASAVASPFDGRPSPRMDPSQAIGWSLSNATNSSQPNLSVLYQMPAVHAEEPSPDNKSQPLQNRHSYTNALVSPGLEQGSGSYSRNNDHRSTSNISHDSLVSPRRVTTSEATLLGLHSPYPHPAPRPSNSHATHNQAVPISSSTSLNSHAATYNYIPSTTSDRHVSDSHMGSRHSDIHSSMNPQAGDLLIESQDIDMSALHHQDQLPLPFTGLPWLEYLPQDVLSYFGEHQNYPLLSPDEGTHPPSH